jgi:hypothetical protein
MDTYTVYHGDNGDQVFWETEKAGALALMKNKAKGGIKWEIAQQWWAIYNEQLVDDKKELEIQRKTNSNISSVVLSAPTARELANRLEAELHIRIVFETSKHFVHGKGGRMKLVEQGET